MSKTTGIPAYCPNSSGQARVTLKDVFTGQTKEVLLGKYETEASKEE